MDDSVITLPAGFSMVTPTMEDAERAADLANSYYEYAVGERPIEAENLRTAWTSPGFDLPSSARAVVDSANRWVGFANLWNAAAPHVEPGVTLWTHPDLPGLPAGDIAKTLATWAETRAREDLSKAPEDAEVVLGMEIPEAYKETNSFLEDHGFKVNRLFFRMIRDLTPPLPAGEIPAGYRLETHADRDSLIDIVHCLEKSFVDHYGYVAMDTAERLKRWEHGIQGNRHYDPTMWYLALAGDTIAGICLCDPTTTEDPRMGYVAVLGVTREHRKKGLGSALLRHAFLEMAKRGQERVSLGVDGESLTGATRIYENVGMTRDQTYYYLEKLLRPGKSYRTETLDADTSGSP
jgi:mycothiol synthase